MQLGVSEILDRANGIDDRELRVAYLKHAANHKSLHTVLQYALDPNIKWLITKLPPFKLNDAPGIETQLLAEARTLYLFVEGGNDNVKQAKREVLFMQLLENLHPADVNLIEHMIQKKLPYGNLTYDVIKEAFPDILPDVQLDLPPPVSFETQGIAPLTAPSAEVFEAQEEVKAVKKTKSKGTKKVKTA